MGGIIIHIFVYTGEVYDKHQYLNKYKKPLLLNGQYISKKFEKEIHCVIDKLAVFFVSLEDA